ncbi:hypothetical protein STEG23_014972 [Scotinomys teguina]
MINSNHRQHMSVMRTHCGKHRAETREKGREEEKTRRSRKRKRGGGEGEKKEREEEEEEERGDEREEEEKIGGTRRVLTALVQSPSRPSMENGVPKQLLNTYELVHGSPEHLELKDASLAR